MVAFNMIDSEAFDAISPVALTAYLRSRGWQRGTRLADGLAQSWLWTENAVGPIDVIVPGDRALRDFTKRIAETLKTLSALEGRSLPEIQADVQRVSSDVIRWRWIQDSTGDGTIPLEQGKQFVGQVWNQLLAAACSAAEPRQFFASRKPAAAMDYLKQARLGQSERGSYVVSVETPVPPLLTDAGEGEVPFERKVTEMLGSSLRSLRHAVTDVINGGDSNAAVLAQAGVSANLCDSLASMLGSGDVNRAVEVRVSFAGSRPGTASLGEPTRFSSDLSPAIGQLGHHLRETATREDFVLVGFVTDLSRSPDNVNGIATIQGQVDEQFRRVEVEVGLDDYDNVVGPAHVQRNIIRCEGELQKVKGKTYRLLNARGFRSFAPQ